MNALLRLVRFSLAPTLLGDLAAGMALVVGTAPLPFGRLLAVLPGSLLLFLAGMAWNAWIDRDEDARTRPTRPLPSGELQANVACSIAVVGVLGAPLSGWLLGGPHGPDLCLWFTFMAVLIGAYHSPLRRSAWLGPLVLGGVRTTNLLAGAVILIGLGSDLSALLAPAALYGAYVAGASMVAHQEDREVRTGWLLAGTTLCLVAVALTATRAMLDPRSGLALGMATLLVAVWHVVPVIPALRRVGQLQGQAEVEAVARLLLGRMLFLTAALSFGSGCAVAGLLSLLAYQLVRLMVRAIPPT